MSLMFTLLKPYLHVFNVYFIETIFTCL